MNYLLDTNIILIYIRDKTKRQILDEKYNPFGKGNTSLVSIVTIGEIKSIARRNY